MSRKFAALKRKEMVNNIMSDTEFYDSSVTEAIYTIRKLKALAESLEDGCIEINDKKDGQIFSKKYDIWFYDNEWEEV